LRSARDFPQRATGVSQGTHGSPIKVTQALNLSQTS
jgi:hypothetical protein